MYKTKLHKQNNLFFYYPLFIFIFIAIFSFTFNQKNTLKKIYLTGYAQGTSWHITYYAIDTVVRKIQIDSILLALDSSLSIYKPYSKIVAFNNSSKGIYIDVHLKNVIKKSLEVYTQTNGLSDITVQPLVEAWGFGAKPIKQYPDSTFIEQTLKCIGANYLNLEDNFLSKSKPCIKIDVNSIAQGYSVDVLANFFATNGIKDYIIEIGGELRIHGRKPGNKKFSVGIEAPNDDDIFGTVMEKKLLIDSGAITTSGNYRKYLEKDGKKISHLIDPRTGYPIQNEMISVTVYAKDAITADAYDNALMTMGLKKSLEFINNRNDLSAWIIYYNANGKIEDTGSSQFYKLIN